MTAPFVLPDSPTQGYSPDGPYRPPELVAEGYKVGPLEADLPLLSAASTVFAPSAALSIAANAPLAQGSAASAFAPTTAGTVTHSFGAPLLSAAAQMFTPGVELDAAADVPLITALAADAFNPAAQIVPPIAYGSGTNIGGASYNLGQTATRSFTNAADDNCVVFALFGMTPSNHTSHTISVSYAGQAMTLVNSYDGGYDSTASSYVWVRWYRLYNPPTGSNTLAVNISGGSGSYRWMQGYIMAYKNVGSVAASSNTWGTTARSNRAWDVTSAADEIMLGALVCDNSPTLSGGVSRFNSYLDVEEKASEGSTTQFLITAPARNWAASAIRLAPM